MINKTLTGIPNHSLRKKETLTLRHGELTSALDSKSFKNFLIQASYNVILKTYISNSKRLYMYGNKYKHTSIK